MSTNSSEQLPQVAVLMAAYNGKPWLAEQVDSILQQEGVVVTLYVSVDQSSDGTEEFINLLALNDKRIRALPFGLRFGGAGPNFYHLINSVDFSRYDFIALSDQDDIWRKNKLAKASSSIETGNWDAYSSNVTAFWPDGKVQLIHKAQTQVQWDFLFEAAGPGCTYVLTRTLASHLQEFIRGHWQKVLSIDLHDWFIYSFARANNYRWTIESFSGLLYRQHMSNQVGANVGSRALYGRFKKITSGWWLGQAAQIADLLGLHNQPFVQSWCDGTRLGYLNLSFHFWQCRRRLRDKLFFLFLNLYLSMFKPPSPNNCRYPLKNEITKSIDLD